VIYKCRDVVERCFNRLKQFRAIATRYDATTVRGHGRQLGELAKQGSRYNRSHTPRPTAAQLVNTARDRNKLINQLRRFGYLR